MRLAILIGIFLVTFLPSSLQAEELNAGFVQGLWYAPEPVIAGESTRIYVALRNNTEHDLTGTVRFNDNGTRIGISSVSALPGRLVEAWIDWTPSYGEHTITASLTDVRVQTIGETPTVAEVENTIAEDTIFADYDTDSDGLVNGTDTDDDNDTVSDSDETAKNTDPLKADPVQKTPDEITETITEKSDGSGSKSNESLQEADTQELQFQSVKGLEQYVPNKKMHTVIESVTNTINDSKNDLDTYREKRTNLIEEYFSSTPGTTTVVSEDSPTSTTATITRSQAKPKESFLESTTHAGRALASGIYTLVLFVASSALAHPAVLELILLLFIILFIYRTARRFGRRRMN